MVNNWITVATFNNYVDANLAKQLLEAEGIKCYLANESLLNLAWHLTVAVGWIKLQVKPQDIDLAKTILTAPDYEIETSADELQPDDEIDDIEILSWADQTADRAFRAAVISLIFIFLPIQLYSLWLLIQLFISRRQISQNRQIKVLFALLIDLLNLLIIWGILF